MSELRRRRAGPVVARFSALLDELERRAVHAIPKAGRVRAVGEDVAEVGAAVRAAGLGPDHPVGRVRRFLDRLLVDGCVEARPTGARLELGVGGEQRLTTTHTGVRAVVVAVPILTGERSLGSRL